MFKSGLFKYQSFLMVCPRFIYGSIVCVQLTRLRMEIVTGKKLGSGLLQSKLEFLTMPIVPDTSSLFSEVKPVMLIKRKLPEINKSSPIVVNELKPSRLVIS